MMNTEDIQTKTNIREYGEKTPVEIIYYRNRMAIKAYNEGGCNCTAVDLLDVITWVKKNMPELLAIKV